MKKLTTQQFIEKAIKAHGNKYEYSQVRYINSRIKVKIKCPIHGVFEQTPDKHININRGCYKCRIHNIPETQEQFINKAIKKHNNRYSYELVNYHKSNKKVKIKCPIHGVFEQKPYSHIHGHGCSKCAYTKHKGVYSLKHAHLGRYNHTGYLYFIKMYNANESFIKIGISIDINQRINTLKNKSKYKVDILYTLFFDDFNKAVIKEHIIHKKYRKYKYVPNHLFGGHTECFTNKVLS